MKLPELSALAEPQFVDAASCRAWLDQLPLANVASAQRDLLAELEVFNAFPVTAAKRLAVMEAVREAVAFVQVEQAKRFVNRPLPLAEAESAVFDDTIELWEQMRLGYLRCLQSALAGDAAMRAEAALLTQRIGAYCGLKMFHHFRAYREVPASEWSELHEIYAYASRLGIAEEPVKDFLNRDIHDSSPRIAYVRAVLMGAANPYELTQRQLTFVAFLLERWASKVEVSSQPMREEKGVSPIVVEHGGERRYLDVRKLGHSLRNRVGLLRQGESPAKLALGEDCVQPSCEQQLVSLFRQWCQTPAAAKPRGQLAIVQLCSELAAIHDCTGGSLPQEPADETELTMQQRQELETLGRIRTPVRRERLGSILEDWTLDEEESQELVLRRRAGAPGKRLSHWQLVAVRREREQFSLGHVRWLVAAASGELRAGVRLLPGVPRAIVLRATGLNARGERIKALALGAVPSLESPPSLVLPAGSYRPNRLLDHLGEKPMSLRLTSLIERGADFERAAYQPA